MSKDIKSMYVHVPFCENICSYCDFKRFGYNSVLVKKWLIALKEEIKGYNINENLETIYIGGGTPSALSYDELNQLLQIIQPYSNNVVEYTIECNPESVDNDKILLLKQYKVNRISLGVQSFDSKLLKLMNRKHDTKTVIDVINMFRQNDITNISIDLMYSLPFQSIKMFEHSLNMVKQLNITHISLYSLTIEENSQFKKQKLDKLDDDIECDMYLMAIKTLSSFGFTQYEISNFSLIGYKSKHNLAYWNYDDFYGISIGASGKINNIRYDNTGNFIEYCKHNYIEEKYELDLDEMMFENIMMSLRLKKGLNILAFNKKYNCDLLLKYKHALSIADEKKYLIIKDNNLMTTNIGFMLLNEVLQLFMD